MQAKKIGFLLLLVSCYRLSPALAQGTEKQQARQVLQSMSDRYKSYRNLSFTIAYKYAGEDRPGVYLDSLKGNLKISGDRYKYVLDSTEFIGSKDWSVILFKKDRILFLAKPSAALQTVNPLALLDSLVWKNDSVDCRLETSKEQQKVIISFRPGMTTKRIEYIIDRGSGLIVRMINIVQSRQLYEHSIQSRVDDLSSYAIVETDFSNYREGAFEERELDPGRYFKKQDGQYVTLAPYESYKIFLGTPDL
jgi:hypothetical protein